MYPSVSTFSAPIWKYTFVIESQLRSTYDVVVRVADVGGAELAVDPGADAQARRHARSDAWSAVTSDAFGLGMRGYE